MIGRTMLPILRTAGSSCIVTAHRSPSPRSPPGDRWLNTRPQGKTAHVSDRPTQDELVAAVRELTAGRDPDSVIDAVGMEAHGSPVAKLAHQVTGLMPDKIAEKMMERAGVDRLAALQLAIELVRRGGTISIAGVYGGLTNPLPMMTLFDKQVQLDGAGLRSALARRLPLAGDR
jgi:threonine dehydrogenase-like Zn-dependent dehydrogenase